LEIDIKHTLYLTIDEAKGKKKKALQNSIISNKEGGFAYFSHIR